MAAIDNSLQFKPSFGPTVLVPISPEGLARSGGLWGAIIPHQYPSGKFMATVRRADRLAGRWRKGKETGEENEAEQMGGLGMIK
ncbi:hypothetical protein E2C01_046832 [Portunus trituberculatus]|uniref:Uncharacterized protein n=1 Tax=Portunus trituberculatus TaxID=210409 RepID=A0A5B7FZK8_PORTR|nr:hypothetical protein [Portunus trituberculatus]